MEKLKNIPSLRFPVFDGDFEQIKFGKLYSFQTTNSLSRDKLNYEEGKVYNIHYGDIHTKFQHHFYLRNESVPYINGDVDLSKIKAELYCKTGDIIIADASEDYADIGKSIELIDIDNVKLLAGLHTLLARPISDKIFIGFTSYLLKSWTLRKQIMTIAQGSKVLSLSTSRVSNLELNIPTLPEQQIIASFLSAVDEKIQQLSRKKELLSQYKKGVMQQLFSGKLRFKDENGNDYADWEEKKLGDTLEITIDNRGKTPPTLEHGIPLLEVNSIGNKEIKFQVVSKFVTDETFKSWFRKYLKKGDVLFSTVGNTALCSYYDGKIKACIAQNIVGLRFKNDNSLFMYYLLIEERNNNKFKQIEMGAVQPSVKVSQMVDLLFDIPCVLEQAKIANFLSSIDGKIESTSKQINQTQGFKKGLLQQLFV